MVSKKDCLDIVLQNVVRHNYITKTVYVVYANDKPLFKFLEEPIAKLFLCVLKDKQKDSTLPMTIAFTIEEEYSISFYR